MPSVAFYTLGCKLNFSESSAIARSFENRGWNVEKFENGADVYVINTCSVTDHADRKCKKVVKEAKKINAEARVVVIGCYAQLKPQEIIEIPGVDAVLGAAEKFNLPDHIEAIHQGSGLVLNSPIKEVKNFSAAWSLGERTRTFLKVQDGCNYFCSFCTIPLARGRSRSDTIENVVKSATAIGEQGIKEIVLTGVNIGDFGYPNLETFQDLVFALDEVEGIERFRISSIEPNLLNTEIIEFIAKSKRFVPHFHIPLQSGSDRILKSMRRRYERKLYKQRVEKIKALMPDACIGVDVIVGFPGETEEEFLETYRFINELDISYLHVFAYSERPDTTAVRLDGRVPNSVRTERREMLQILSEKKRRFFYEQQIGKTAMALFEGKVENGFIYGHTENYVRVKMSFDPLMINELKTVQFQAVDNSGDMQVEIVENTSVQAV